MKQNEVKWKNLHIQYDIYSRHAEEHEHFRGKRYQ